MAKKLTKHGNSWAIIIDKPILKLLGITEKSTLDMSIADGSLVVTPLRKKTKKTAIDIKQMANKLMNKYKEAFEKLAKT
jgi:putative addiction module antidote